MKFKGEISKIDEQGVKAKEDNPIEKPKHIEFLQAGWADNPIDDVFYKVQAWKKAEANRKEYEVIGIEDIFKTNKKKLLTEWDKPILAIGDRIEGDIINNEIVNVKLIN